jgi:hypothetical protein
VTISLRFPHQNPVHASPLPHPRYVPAYLILIDYITSTIVDEEYMKLLVIKFYLLSCGNGDKYSKLWVC